MSKKKTSIHKRMIKKYHMIKIALHTFSIDGLSKIFLYIFLGLFPFINSCKNNDDHNIHPDEITILDSSAYLDTLRLKQNSMEVDIIIDKPALGEVDVLLVFHGTISFDSLILNAAYNSLNAFKRILNNSEIMVISVAYPEENLLMSDNVQHSEMALLWLKEKAAKQLNIKIGKIFLAGHSQGGNIVTILNTKHAVDGVIANAPGPIDLVFRCGLEEDEKIPKGSVCRALRAKYGSTQENPDAYIQRSLRNFTSGYKSDILFVQGMEDGNIQMRNYPIFKSKVQSCNDCKSVEFLEIIDGGHPSLFQSVEAINAFNAFIMQKR